MARLCNGYRFVPAPGHPRATEKGDVQEHILVAESCLGKYLPPGAVVHHVDGDRSNNRKDNLVICQSLGYHQILHRRLRALQTCGHAGWRRCRFCKEYDNPDAMHPESNGKAIKYCHLKCKREDAVRYRRRKRTMEVAHERADHLVG